VRLPDTRMKQRSQIPHFDEPSPIDPSLNAKSIVVSFIERLFY
jgi:hypothetical protein